MRRSCGPSIFSAALDRRRARHAERRARGVRGLARAVDGISDSMLAVPLGQLCDAGLVSRTVTEGPPLSATYALTDAGRALLPALEQITRWSE
jgi:DNA-binding HxlR family transcriptional regulator